MRILFQLLMYALLWTAVLMDFRHYRISNRLIAFGIGSGILSQLLSAGLSGFWMALTGLLLPVLLLGLPYILSMIGAADIKLFMLIGAFMGPGFTLLSIIFALLIGAFISLILMITYGNFFYRLDCFRQYIYRCFFSKKIQPYYNLKNPQKGETIHFSLCIALAAICVQFFI